jgi:hypothetical protein
MIAARIAFLVAGVGIAALAFVHAASENQRYLLDPYATPLGAIDGEMASALVDSGFKSEMAAEQAQAGGTLPKLSDGLMERARDAYANDPLEVSSLRSIALGGIVQEDEERARQLLRVAARISRRDSIADLWLAQDYGKSGDVASMMASFDYTLRTSERAREFAMAPVVNTLATSQTYAPLGTLLARRPDWEVDFWAELAANPVGLANAASFFEASGVPIEQVPANIRAALYLNLNRIRNFDTLFRLAALDAGSRETVQALAAGNIVSTDGGSPLAWNLHSAGSYSATVHKDTGELRIDGRSGAFGVAADRVIRLERDQRLSLQLAEPVPENANVALTVRCADESKRELAVVTARPGDRRADGILAASGCDYARVELTFQIDQGRRDALLQVAKISVQPA